MHSYTITKPHRFNVKTETPCGNCGESLFTREAACTLTIEDPRGNVIARELLHRERCVDEMLELHDIDPQEA